MATIKDVAQLAGVGLSTASRVVRGQGSVSPAKLERVKKAIATLGFRPNHTARTLLTGSSRMIGVYIPLMSGTFYTVMLQTMDAELRAAGVHMMIAFGIGPGGARRQAIEGVEFLLERGCDGVVVMTDALLEEDLSILGDKRGQLLVLNHSYPSLPDQCFTVNHFLGGQLAARTLLDYKHRDIAVIAGPARVADNLARLDGFMSVLADDGIDTAKMWLTHSDFSAAGGWAAAQALVEARVKCTALFCANDEMAVGALSYFQEAGIRVPQDISVIGYDDVPSAAYSAPRLTSVHVPWREMTQAGMSQLLNTCYDLNRRVTRDFPVSVSLRASLAKPPPRRRKAA